MRLCLPWPHVSVQWIQPGLLVGTTAVFSFLHMIRYHQNVILTTVTPSLHIPVVCSLEQKVTNGYGASKMYFTLFRLSGTFQFLDTCYMNYVTLQKWNINCPSISSGALWNEKTQYSNISATHQLNQLKTNHSGETLIPGVNVIYGYDTHFNARL